jgi:hypothetical protein
VGSDELLDGIVGETLQIRDLEHELRRRMQHRRELIRELNGLIGGGRNKPGQVQKLISERLEGSGIPQDEAWGLGVLYDSIRGALK